MSMFQKIFGSRETTAPPSPAIPDGQRVYAIGDVHGRLDLFKALSLAIDRDDAARQPAETTVILLGDLVDRGPESSGVVAAARNWAERRRLRFLGGNHEELFLQSFHSVTALKSFLRFGGRETLLSYGLDPDARQAMPLEDFQHEMAQAIPREDRQFLDSFEITIAIGDYLFVHAGINPALTLGEQQAHDCRWIREPFLSHRRDFGAFVVHGHTITDEVDERVNRIGIDTGAYKTGRLTALRLEGTEREVIQTQITHDDGPVEVHSFACTTGVIA